MTEQNTIGNFCNPLQGFLPTFLPSLFTTATLKDYKRHTPSFFFDHRWVCTTHVLSDKDKREAKSKEAKWNPHLHLFAVAKIMKHMKKKSMELKTVRVCVSAWWQVSIACCYIIFSSLSLSSRSWLNEGNGNCKHTFILVKEVKLELTWIGDPPRFTRFKPGMTVLPLASFCHDLNLCSRLLQNSQTAGAWVNRSCFLLVCDHQEDCRR